MSNTSSLEYFLRFSAFFDYFEGFPTGTPCPHHHHRDERGGEIFRTNQTKMKTFTPARTLPPPTHTQCSWDGGVVQKIVLNVENLKKYSDDDVLPLLVICERPGPR